jgi:hypothetical protein
MPNDKWSNTPVIPDIYTKRISDFTRATENPCILGFIANNKCCLITQNAAVPIALAPTHRTR